jgi:hypothetical protein
MIARVVPGAGREWGLMKLRWLPMALATMLGLYTTNALAQQMCMDARTKDQLDQALQWAGDAGVAILLISRGRERWVKLSDALDNIDTIWKLGSPFIRVCKDEHAAGLLGPNNEYVRPPPRLVNPCRDPNPPSFCSSTLLGSPNRGNGD